METSLDTSLIDLEEGEGGLTMSEKQVALAAKIAMGTNAVDIADELGVSTGWVRQHKRDKEVLALVKELQEEALSSAKFSITHASMKAARTMNELLESPIPSIQLAAAKDILDRLGLKVQPVEKKDIHISYSDMDKEDLKKSILERVKVLEEDDK